MKIVATGEYRGRVFGAYGTTASLLMLISSGLAGASADWAGATAQIFVSAVIYVVSGFLVWLLLKTTAQLESATTTHLPYGKRRRGEALCNM